MVYDEACEIVVVLCVEQEPGCKVCRYALQSLHSHRYFTLKSALILSFVARGVVVTEIDLWSTDPGFLPLPFLRGGWLHHRWFHPMRRPQLGSSAQPQTNRGKVIWIFLRLSQNSINRVLKWSWDPGFSSQFSPTVFCHWHAFFSASKMTYFVSGGALCSTLSLCCRAVKFGTRKGAMILWSSRKVTIGLAMHRRFCFFISSTGSKAKTGRWSAPEYGSLNCCILLLSNIVVNCC